MYVRWSEVHILSLTLTTPYVSLCVCMYFMCRCTTCSIHPFTCTPMSDWHETAFSVTDGWRRSIYTPRCVTIIHQKPMKYDASIHSYAMTYGMGRHLHHPDTANQDYSLAHSNHFNRSYVHLLASALLAPMSLLIMMDHKFHPAMSRPRILSSSNYTTSINLT